MANFCKTAPFDPPQRSWRHYYPPFSCFDRTVFSSFNHSTWTEKPSETFFFRSSLLYSWRFVSILLPKLAPGLILSGKVSTLHSPRSIKPKLDVTYLFCRIFVMTLGWEVYSSIWGGSASSSSTSLLSWWKAVRWDTFSDQICLHH